MAEGMSYLEATARRICRANAGNPDGLRIMGGAWVPAWREYEPDARAALEVVGFAAARMQMPVGSLTLLPVDMAQRIAESDAMREEHAQRVAQARDRIARAGRPAGSFRMVGRGDGR